MKIETVLQTSYSENVEFQSSFSLETQRIPDPWLYYISGQKLISPITGRPVEESIAKETPRDIADLNAFQKIQKWAAEGGSGVAIWISPPAESDLSAKAVISKIVYDSAFKRRLFNRGLCFDWDIKYFLPFVKNADNITGPEDFRIQPLFLNEDKFGEFIEVMRKVDPEQIKMIESGEDILIKENLKAEIASGQSTPTGKYAPSCPTRLSAFNSMYETSLKTYFECPKCRGKILSGFGITTCPHCGARKEDYESHCD